MNININDLTGRIENECYRLIDAMADFFWAVVFGIYDAVQQISGGRDGQLH